jgi:hypothetical protein
MLRPAEDFLFVPASKIEQISQHAANLRHRELRVFFFPTAVSEVSGTREPSMRERYGDANRSSPGVRTRPARTLLCRTESPSPHTSDSPPLPRAFVAESWPVRSTADISVPAPAPTNGASTSARDEPREDALQRTTPSTRRTHTLVVLGSLRQRSPASMSWREFRPRAKPLVAVSTNALRLGGMISRQVQRRMGIHQTN